MTGLVLREQEQAAARRRVHERRSRFARFTPAGLAWVDGTEQRATRSWWRRGFAPTWLTSLAGYGPSASTIGANRAGRVAARNVIRQLAAVAA